MQFYIQVGITFPFNYRFQIFLSDEITRLIKPSPKFIQLFREDYTLAFRISAKKELAINEVLGPIVFKRDKDVEYSIFLPYTPIMQQINPNESALEHLFDGVYGVLENYEIDISLIKKRQKKIIDKILNSLEMFGDED